MAKKELKKDQPDDEFQQIMTHVNNGDNFLLSGGAGSGKTYTLVQVIKKIIKDRPNVKIACMTYTNVAVREIEERVNNKNLSVSTIHDFLWSNIKHFQKELKSSIITLINNEEETKIKILEEEEAVEYNFFDNLEKGIQYKEYLKLKEGIISHDELLIIANQMFKEYPKLSGILKDKFKFIFADEYQDTQQSVIEILLKHLKNSQKKNVIGFFGDAMQSIYDGIGDLNEYKDNKEGGVKEVTKVQNRRNPKFVIDLANQLRTDGLQQEPSDDEAAPNMNDGCVKQGSVKFIYSKEKTLQDIREHLGWNFEDSKKIKELNLTHNLIADKAGFRELMDIYDKDKILDFRDRIKKYISDSGIESDFSNKTFEEVVDFLKNGKTGGELRKVQPTQGMQDFIDKNLELFEIAKEYNYNNFLKIYVDKDQLLDDKKQDVNSKNKKSSKRDDLIKHLFKIQNNISLYKNKRFNEFIRVTEYKIDSVEAKQKLKTIIDDLEVTVENKTIEEIINIANIKGICKIDDRLKKFKTEKTYIYDQVIKLSFKKFQKLYNYLEGYTPFSTQHSIKGAEFDNVLVILDNGKWNKYNFEGLFLENGKKSILERTQKIFYVCCTRAKENLAVYFHQPSEEVITKTKDWFGEDNVVNLDE